MLSDLSAVPRVLATGVISKMLQLWAEEVCWGSLLGTSGPVMLEKSFLRYFGFAVISRFITSLLLALFIC